MIDRIGRSGALGREAVQAAIKQAAERVSSHGSERVGDADAALSARDARSAGGAGGADFGRALADGLQHVDADVRAAETLPIDLLTGKVDDFHQIAVQLKSAEL